MRKRKRESGNDERSAVQRPRITPTDIQQKEFRLAFRGYSERDVDEFLDRLTEDLAAYVEESRRLRERASVGGTSADADNTSRQAEAVLAKAREEAARIVREAEERAAVVGVGATGIDTRGIIAPYLSRERDFLQSLGQLVQGHAETIRGMVQAHRERTEPSVPLAQLTVPEPIRVHEPEEPSAAASSVPASEEAVAVSDEPSAPVPAPEPEAADAVQPVGSERQRSLRELFWGED